MANLLDENVIRSFDVANPAIEEAIRFGVLYEAEAVGDPESVQCAAFPPDGVKVVLSCDDRRLTLFFFRRWSIRVWQVDGRQTRPMGEGELPLRSKGRPIGRISTAGFWIPRPPKRSPTSRSRARVKMNGEDRAGGAAENSLGDAP